MQVLDEESKVYFNFINSLNCEYTRDSYKYCLEKFLGHYGIYLETFLKLPQEDTSNLIIKYLVDQKIFKVYKSLIMSTLKHACEINDIILMVTKPL